MGLEYAVFAVPAGSEAEIVNAGGAAVATTIDRATDLVCTGLDESVTVKVGLVVLLAVGVPEMTPVAGARLRPLGSALLDQV
jgi:hypothetical protein